MQYREAGHFSPPKFCAFDSSPAPYSVTTIQANNIGYFSDQVALSIKKGQKRLNPNEKHIQAAVEIVGSIKSRRLNT